MSRVLPSEWRWQGGAGHLCVGERCQYHLSTVVGCWLVSTVGEYVPWSREGSRDDTFVEVGVGRLFETMVFRARAPAAACLEAGCSDWHQESGQNIDFDTANTRAEAHAAHMAMCHRWSRRGPGYRARS